MIIPISWKLGVNILFIQTIRWENGKMRHIKQGATLADISNSNTDTTQIKYLSQTDIPKQPNLTYYLNMKVT